MASLHFARAAAQSAFARYHHRDWSETYDLTPAQRQATTTATQTRRERRSEEQTSSRHPMRIRRNPLAGQPRRVRPELEDSEIRYEAVSLGQIVRVTCETATRRLRHQRRTDNSRHWHGHRDRHSSNFEVELVELDLEMMPRPGDAQLLAA